MFAAKVGDSNSPWIVEDLPPSTPPVTVRASALTKSTKTVPKSPNGLDTIQFVERPTAASADGAISLPSRLASYEVHSDTLLATEPLVSFEAEYEMPLKLKNWPVFVPLVASNVVIVAVTDNGFVTSSRMIVRSWPGSAESEEMTICPPN